MTVKILSLNTWHSILLNDILDFLRQEDADILLLQEVYDGKDSDLEPKYRTFDIVKEQLNYPATDFASAVIDNADKIKVRQGNAIFSKFPITSQKVTFFNEPYSEDYAGTPETYPTCPRNLQHVVLETPIGEVNVFNLQGVWDLDGDNYSERRQKMSQVIIDNVKNKPNVLLAGDTNAKPTNKAMRNIEQHLNSVFGNDLKTTFNMRRKDNPGYATAAVDLMYVSPNIEVLDRKCPDVDISDHLPIMATLQIKLAKT
jgi:endonuclease/exonuclease/phosphatase family metal-dependent hydrolase